VVRGTFSPARAWRPAVGYRLARTLGRTIKPMLPAQLFEHAAQAAPEFAPIVAEHLRDNDELLPHVLMAELLRFVGQLLERTDEQAATQCGAILGILEREVEGESQETRDLIALSFLEHLEAEAFFKALYALLGPRTRAAHARFAW
jgi:hypothetical protein